MDLDYINTNECRWKNVPGCSNQIGRNEVTCSIGMDLISGNEQETGWSKTDNGTKNAPPM